jgi:ABC-type Fe3+-siderophore transport system permease subunit
MPDSTGTLVPAQGEAGRKSWATQSASIHRWWSVLGAMLFLTAAIGLTCLMFGAQTLTFQELWSAFVQTSNTDKSAAQIIVWEIRFPRILMGLFIGASLAITGASLQALVRNPLADPYVLGVSSGAALGATMGVALGLGSFAGGVGVPLTAFVGGAVTILIVYGIATSQGRLPVQTLLLAGVIVNAICSALMMFANSILNPAALYRVVVWLMGSLGAPSYPALLGMGGCAGMAMVLLLRQSQELNLIAVSEDTALSLGVEVARVQRTVFFVSALLTGAVVSVSGMIGFVGMVIPHVARMLWGADHRFLLPISALGGGILLMVADTVARTIVAPEEVPVGVITALIGGPFFIYLLMTRQYRFVV